VDCTKEPDHSPAGPVAELIEKVLQHKDHDMICRFSHTNRKDDGTTSLNNHETSDRHYWRGARYEHRHDRTGMPENRDL